MLHNKNFSKIFKNVNFIVDVRKFVEDYLFVFYFVWNFWTGMKIFLELRGKIIKKETLLQFTLLWFDSYINKSRICNIKENLEKMFM